MPFIMVAVLVVGVVVLALTYTGPFSAPHFEPQSIAAAPSSPVQPQLAAAEQGPPLVALKLCRLDVYPCQTELNLSYRDEVTLGLYLEPLTPASDGGESPVPGLPSSPSSMSLVAWYLHLGLAGDDSLEIPAVDRGTAPFQERGIPDLALEGWGPMDSGSTNLDGQRYFRLANYHTEDEDSPTVHDWLEYGVILLPGVAAPTGQETAPPPASPVKSGGVTTQDRERLLLGALTVQGRRGGTARFEAGAAGATPPFLVALEGNGGPVALPVQVASPMAQVSVGWREERARLVGRLWVEYPTAGSYEVGELRPYTQPFRLEIWSRDARPVWEGGTDLPLATYYNLVPDKTGAYEISDVSSQTVPTGNYDLRVKGEGTLSALAKNVFIDTAEIDTRTVEIKATFNALPPGDLTNDNQVDEDDLETLQAQFGLPARAIEGGPAADLNGDGRVDAQDFSLLVANFGQQGN